MNQRIEQLAEQCRFEIQGINCEVLGQGLDEQKFAESIVRECAAIASNTNLEDVDGGDSAVLGAAREQILEHFGVEE